MWKEGLWALGLSLAGCSSTLKTGASSDAGPAPVQVDAGTSTPAATGAGCGQDPTTGATLCTGISVCPNLVIDTAAYPDCGFRIHGDAIDLECLCSGMLCPIGSPATCDEALQLLRGQTEGTVCSQVSDGRCTSPGSAGSVDAGAPNGCDPTCRDECAGVPDCVQGCGC